MHKSVDLRTACQQDCTAQEQTRLHRSLRPLLVARSLQLLAPRHAGGLRSLRHHFASTSASSAPKLGADEMLHRGGRAAPPLRYVSWVRSLRSLPTPCAPLPAPFAGAVCRFAPAPALGSAPAPAGFALGLRASRLGGARFGCSLSSFRESAHF